MAEANPLELATSLRETLQAYLPTTLPISQRYPRLREEFRRLVSAQPLVKGPFVEALPDFEKGKMLRQLLSANGGYLHDGFSGLPEEWLDRRLHLHQEQAFRTACERGANLVVATGTGSGKTECFLFPTVDQLLKQPRTGAGVRCLLIYPMNALANDQLYYRIAPLLGVYLRDFGITFGRFTGQIKAKTKRDEEESRLLENDKLMAALGHPREIPSNWLLTREEMLATPPDVLITNYAMLEHLLLLPRNAPLFAQDTLSAIVLDEVHTYAGAQATEIAFLLRKLKHRLKIDRPIQCFATSASLPQSEEADRDVQKFASDLFGEPFETVIRGRRIRHQALSELGDAEFSLTASEWIRIGDCLADLRELDDLDTAQWRQFLADAGLERLEAIGAVEGPDKSLPRALFGFFSRSAEVRKAAARLDAGGVVQFESLANELFPEESEFLDRARATSAVLGAGMVARRRADEFPLLPARYHLATNTIEGVSVRLAHDQPEGWQALSAFQTYQDDTGQFFPLLVCRKCGQPYVEVFEQDGGLRNRALSGSGIAKRRIFWLGTPTDAPTADEDDSGEDLADSGLSDTVRRIDPATGNPMDADQPGCLLHEAALQQDEEDNNRYLRRCPACGGSTGTTDTEVVTRLHPGNEALGSVVTQKVLEALPRRAPAGKPVPFGGRQLLSFSDNRQNAAFFAPYLERTSRELAVRTAIHQVLRDDASQSLDFDTLADRILRYWRRSGQPVLLDAGGEMVTDRVRQMDLLVGQIAVEFCTPGGRRTSLDALGLASVSYCDRALGILTREIAAYCNDWSQSDRRALVRLLLETVRREKAITNLWEVDLTDSFIWGPAYRTTRSFSLFKDERKLVRYAWLTGEGATYHNRRTWYLIHQLGLSEDRAREILAGFWEAMTKQSKILVRAEPGWAVDAKRILVSAGRGEQVYVCSSCGLRQRHVVRDRCSAFRCTGTTRILTDAEREEEKTRNHYIRSYEAGKASTLRASEHTASLSTDFRERIEREFAEGQINVLSCTTTMEMGVDLGDLEAVVNLNIPPSISNYQQRTGRAGRRAQAAPFCVTVARSSPYDQATFLGLAHYLAQPAAVPYFRLDNPTLFRRHQLAVVLSHFLRHRISDLEKNAPTLKDFFTDSFGEEAQQNFLDDLYGWVESADGQAALHEGVSLAERVPLELREGLGVHGSALADIFTDRIVEFAEEVSGRWEVYTRKFEEADKLEDPNAKARGISRWNRLRQQYMDQFLVDQLSKRGLVPTYSFPTHSLTLEVVTDRTERRFPGASGDISLSRDASLGISEYAPGAEVVAGGRVWQSAGLMRYPRMFMPRQPYCVCAACHHVDVAVAEEDMPTECSNCGSDSGRQRRQFIEPRGFITSYEDRRGRDTGMVRKRERPADEARLIALPVDSAFQDTDHPEVKWSLLPADSAAGETSGEMVIINRGPKGFGYHICEYCNHAEAAQSPKSKKQQHRQPLGGEQCPKDWLPAPIDLAHRFSTDVLVVRLFDPLPHPEKDTDAVDHYESFSRTLTEAVRYAAADVLEIGAGEIRATFKRNRNRLDVILYDSVGGGAGYCKRLSEISATRLLETTLRRLDCPRECSSSCTSCLNEYANQRIWDQLDRTRVQPWLDAMIRSALPGPYEHVGAAIWAAPSLEALAERLSGYQQINFLASRLGLEEDEDEKIRKWLTGRMDAGQRVCIYVQQRPTASTLKMGALARSAIRHLHPYFESGMLAVKWTDTLPDDVAASVPRVWCGEVGRRKAWFTGTEGVSLFRSLLPQPVYQGDLTDVSAAALGDLAKAQDLPAAGFSAALPLNVCHLKEGARDRVRKVFGDLAGVHVEKLEIRDPYLGAGERNMDATQRFIKDVIGLAGTIQQICLIGKEIDPRRAERRWQPARRVQEALELLLRNVGAQVSVKILEHRFAPRFHDRVTDAVVVDPDGVSHTLRYDLTGGIDHLLDERRETKVFKYTI
jgi:hypothetical protein